MKVTAVTGGRADWGLLSPVLEAIRADAYFDLSIVVTGQHLMPSGQRGFERIRHDGFAFETLNLGLAEQDDEAAIAHAMGRAVCGFADIFGRSSPDILLLLGDRYEILAAAQTALLFKIPVAHVCGGDVTEGAMDDAIRHSITKMSHLHFVTNIEAKRRVEQLGEIPEHVYLVGNPGLDHIHTTRKLTRDDFFARVGLEPGSRNVLVTFHPVTLESDSERQCAEMLRALERFDETGMIFTGSNADPRGLTLTRMVRQFADRSDNAVFIDSLGTELYLNALRHTDAIVGNSSSGLYEAPSFGLPAVNIGDRQKGRMKAVTVVDCAPNEEAIATALREALSARRGEHAENPYGDGHASEAILAAIKAVDTPALLTRKRFHDLMSPL